MHLGLRTHTLLRIPDARCLIADSPPPAKPPTKPPEWVETALTRAPWVVIRRARPVGTTLAVGVRGALRHERFAAWLPQDAILERVTPQPLAQQRAWLSAARRDSIAALAVLDAVAAIMKAHGLAGVWGPTGSVGFELASAYPSAHAGSDLDLCVQLPGPPPGALAQSLALSLNEQLATLAVRCDVLLETPAGALALAEYAQQRSSFVLRTPDGPRLRRIPATSAQEPTSTVADAAG
jgi:phosphoribosyl-dephospho-CoA transferase